MDIHTEHTLQNGHLRLYADIFFTAGQLRLIIHHIQKEQEEGREGGMARNSALSTSEVENVPLSHTLQIILQFLVY